MLKIAITEKASEKNAFFKPTSILCCIMTIRLWRSAKIYEDAIFRGCRNTRTRKVHYCKAFRQAQHILRKMLHLCQEWSWNSSKSWKCAFLSTKSHEGQAYSHGSTNRNALYWWSTTGVWLGWGNLIEDGDRQLRNVCRYVGFPCKRRGGIQRKIENTFFLLKKVARQQFHFFVERTPYTELCERDLGNANKSILPADTREIIPAWSWKRTPGLVRAWVWLIKTGKTPLTKLLRARCCRTQKRGTILNSLIPALTCGSLLSATYLQLYQLRSRNATSHGEGLPVLTCK